MLRFVTPHLRLDRVLDLPSRRLWALGIEGLLLDLDGTLKGYTAGEIPADVTDWVQGLRAEGFRLCLLSNGRPGRVGAFARVLEIPFVARACKPLPFGCHAAVRALGLRRDRVAVVGDQVFADVLAGRLAGLFTVLVPPTSPEEPWFTRLKRPLERRVLMRLPGGPLTDEVNPASPRTGEVTS
jgi:HAD superfamily phosphatase (TIGR01668 family)